MPIKLYNKGNKYGYKDIDSGRTVIPPIYENGKIHPIIIGGRNYFVVKNQGKWGLVDEDNKIVIDFEFDDIGRPRLACGSPEFVMCFKNQGEGYFKMGIISSKLQVTVPPVLDNFPQNITVKGENTSLYYIHKNEKWGVVSKDGTVLVEPAYTKEEVDGQFARK